MVLFRKGRAGLPLWEASNNLFAARRRFLAGLAGTAVLGSAGRSSATEPALPASPIVPWSPEDERRLRLTPAPIENQIVSEVCAVIGIPNNFEVRTSPNPYNTAATHCRGDKRYILFNREQMNAVALLENGRWATTFVVAHEIGHHLCNHSGSRSLPKEWEADRFAGFAIALLGGTLADGTRLLAKVADGSFVMPQVPVQAEEGRIEAFTEGWTAARDRLPCTESPFVG